MKDGASKPKRCFRGFLLFLGVFFHLAMIGLGIPPLVIAFNINYVVNASVQDTNFYSQTRSKGLLFECLTDTSKLATISQVLPYTSIYPQCALYDFNVPPKSGKSPAPASLLLLNMRLSYAVLYVAGLGLATFALIILVFSSCVCCCCSTRKYEWTNQAFAEMLASLGIFMSFATLCLTAGCALYIYEQFLEIYTPTIDFQFNWASIPSNVQAATQVSVGIGSILMWLSVWSGMTAVMFYAWASFIYKPAYSSNYTDSSNNGHNYPSENLFLPSYNQPPPGSLSVGNGQFVMNTGHNQNLNSLDVPPERPPRSYNRGYI